MPTECARTIFLRPTIPEGPSTLTLSVTSAVLPMFMRAAPAAACAGVEILRVRIGGVEQQAMPVHLAHFSLCTLAYFSLCTLAERSRLAVFNDDGPDNDDGDGIPVSWGAISRNNCLLHIDLHAHTPQRPRWAFTVRTMFETPTAVWRIDRGTQNLGVDQAMVVDYATRRRLSGPEVV